MSPAHHRADIEGMRALAVVLVLLYHLGLSPFAGGFVGVDIFFVISGYLITGLLLREYHSTGRIVFSTFFLRRVRRLAPAIIATTVWVFCVAAALFPQSLMEATARSGVYTLLFASNFLFWSESNYFDLDASAKPLLHTWSLGVEGQFYLLWPFLLLFLWRLGQTRTAIAGMMVIFAVSLALNFIFVGGWVHTGWEKFAWIDEALRDGRATIFYLPIFRFFEFVVGATLVWFTPARSPKGWMADLLAATGLVLIGYAVLAFDETTLFPGAAALVPCIGIAALIWAVPGSHVRAALEAKPVTFLGRISYSLYLVHWPIIVFWTQWRFAPPDGVDLIVIPLTCVFLAWLLYRLVELPYRYARPSSNGRFLLGTMASIAGLAVAGTHGATTQGWSGRIPEARKAMTPAEHRLVEDEFCGEHPNDALITCEVDRGSDRSIYVWGDSHARHLVAGMAATFPDFNIRVLYFSSCHPQSGFEGYFHDYGGRAALAEQCVERNHKAFEYFREYPRTDVVLASYLNLGDAAKDALVEASQFLITELSALGHNVKILGDVIRPEVQLVDCYAVPALFYSDALLEKRCRGDMLVAGELLSENDQLESVLGPDVFINQNDVFCAPDGCNAFLNGRPIYRDSHHLSVYGSQLFVNAARSRLQIEGIRWNPQSAASTD